MHKYTNVLCAVDLTDEADEVVEAASSIASDQGAKLNIVTVIRPLTHAYAGFETAGVPEMLSNFESEARANAVEGLNKLAAESKVAPEGLHIEVGRPADEIRAKAESLGADLIVMGSHGKHGLGLLLGSTANGVLHGAGCDVLTIRIK